jgi:hypothetical protein
MVRLRLSVIAMMLAHLEEAEARGIEGHRDWNVGGNSQWLVGAPCAHHPAVNLWSVWFRPRMSRGCSFSPQGPSNHQPADNPPPSSS